MVYDGTGARYRKEEYLKKRGAIKDKFNFSILSRARMNRII